MFAGIQILFLDRGLRPPDPLARLWRAWPLCGALDRYLVPGTWYPVPGPLHPLLPVSWLSDLTGLASVCVGRSSNA